MSPVPLLVHVHSSVFGRVAMNLLISFSFVLVAPCLQSVMHVRTRSGSPRDVSVRVRRFAVVWRTAEANPSLVRTWMALEIPQL